MYVYFKMWFHIITLNCLQCHCLIKGILTIMMENTYLISEFRVTWKLIRRLSLAFVKFILQYLQTLISHQLPGLHASLCDGHRVRRRLPAAHWNIPWEWGSGCITQQGYLWLQQIVNGGLTEDFDHYRNLYFNYINYLEEKDNVDSV